MSANVEKQSTRGPSNAPAPLELNEATELVLNIDSGYKDLYAARVNDYNQMQSDIAKKTCVSQGEAQVEGEWKYQVMGMQTDQGLRSFARILNYEGSQAHIEIPETLGGLAVEELGDRVFARRKFIESVTMPNTVKRLGKKVFAIDFGLQSIRFSDSITELDRSVLENCRALTEVHLPDALEEIPEKLFWDCMALRELHIPPATKKVDLRSCRFEKIEQIIVHEDNRFLSTDGICLYSSGGERLLCALKDPGRYAIPQGCQEICDNAFKNLRSLRNVTFPSTLLRIGNGAFSRTGVMRLELPDSLREIGNNAFHQCAMLSACNFPNELVSIGAQAFASTKLSKALLPASLESLGSRAFEDTRIRFENNRYFSIDASNEHLASDGTALYKIEDGKKYLVCMLREVKRYKALENTVEVCDGAFSHCAELLSIELPQGLLRIGDAAFEGCVSLARVELPASLEVLGNHAFFKTNVKSLKLGPNLKSIGDVALACAGADHNSPTSALGSITVDEQNPVFYMDGNALCQRHPDGDVIVAACGSCQELRVPEQVVGILDLAFAKVYVKDLYIHAGLRWVSMRAFLNLEGIERVHIEFPHPVDGVTSTTVSFPEDRQSARWYVRAMRVGDDGCFFDFEAYDNQLVREEDSVDMARLVLERMDNPIKLSERSKLSFKRTIAANMHTLSRELMRKREMKTFARLADHEFINNTNIDSLVEKASAWQEAEAAAYLLELKRRKFSFVEEDFSF